MNQPMRLLLPALLASSLAFAQARPDAGTPHPAKPPPKPPPTDAQCILPQLKTPLAFMPGEVLDFNLDALGAEAGKMQMKVLPVKSGALPIDVRVETNTFFSKVRKVKGGATSWLNPKTLRPTRYLEDVMENDVHRRAEVQFNLPARKALLEWSIGEQKGRNEFRYAKDALDTAGAIAALRQLPFSLGLEVCFDAYAIRRMWRVSGKVVELEQHATPLGVFKVWHLAGEAVRTDNYNIRREVHVYITDDAKRLPLAAIGMIDLGAVRATLVKYVRPGEKSARAEGVETLKW